MQQRFTDDLLRSLTHGQRSYISSWCHKKGYGIDLTIGEAIEFLDEHHYPIRLINVVPSHWNPAKATLTGGWKGFKEREIITTLFSYMKDVLGENARS